MISIINITLLSLFGLDMLLTGLYLNMYRKHVPQDSDWTKSEANPIIRFSVRRFGIIGGILLSMIIIYFVLCAITTYFGELSKYFLSGMYLMAVIYHFVNYQALRRVAKWRKKNKEVMK